MTLLGRWNLILVTRTQSVKECVVPPDTDLVSYLHMETTSHGLAAKRKLRVASRGWVGSSVVRALFYKNED